MRRDVCMRLRYLVCDTIHLLGAIGADCGWEGTRARWWRARLWATQK
jgi:hypothetical protein